MLAQDASGNTALHRAAYADSYEICRCIIQIAGRQGELSKLKRLLNNNGETVLNNIMDYLSSGEKGGSIKGINARNLSIGFK